jgi:hypothetical protein
MDPPDTDRYARPQQRGDAPKEGRTERISRSVSQEAPHGGQEAWVQAKADYEQWKVGASNFERTVSGALAEVNAI